MPIISSWYAGFLALVFALLSTRIILYRRAQSISLGDGDDIQMLRRIRAQGNFAEYAPLALLLLAMCEMRGASDWFVHGAGMLLLLGRMSHAIALSLPRGSTLLRPLGMALTFVMITTTALWLLLSPA